MTEIFNKYEDLKANVKVYVGLGVLAGFVSGLGLMSYAGLFLCRI